MVIQIYNSLKAKKEEFTPLCPGQVKMYVCGPTVYDESHLGHLRAAYVFDVIRRYLKYRNFKVTFVRNITDIDDKIINRAKEELASQTGKEKTQDLKQKVKEVAEYYTKLYEEDMQNFGIEKPDIQPKATEHIIEMILLIQKLIEKDLAYESDGDVYFQVRSFPDYGKLSHQGIDQMIVGARIEPGEKKKDPLDFALWKKAKQDEPAWDSPWGKGRPGWHIECSAMSTKYLNQPFDIHGGGRDLIFPHHENEIAQAEAATGRPFSNYWIHNGLLTINNQKMAKSLGNFITIKDILSKYNPDILKIFFLQAHYSSAMDFSWEKMEEVKKAYERIDILRDKLLKMYGTVNIPMVSSGGAGQIKQFEDLFIAYMDDDFNTPKALAVLFDMVSRCNVLLESDEKFNGLILNYAIETMKKITDIFGLKFLKDKPAKISEEELEEKIKQRLEYKKQKKFKAADEIRNQLLQLGIILEDTKDGKTSWRQI